MLVRREVFFAAGGFDEEPGAGLFKDWTFLWKAAVRGSRIEVVPEVLYLYRVGAHGSGQRSPAYESYQRPLRPVADLLPGGLALGLLFAAAAARPTAPPPVNVSTDDRAEPRASRRRACLDSGRQGRARNGLATGCTAGWLPARSPFGGRRRRGEQGLRHSRAAHLPCALLLQRRRSCISSRSTGYTWSRSQIRRASTRSGVILRPRSFRRETARLAAAVARTTRHHVACGDVCRQLFWRTVRMPFYCESQSIRTPLRQGRNVRYVRIPVNRMVGHLRFDIADILRSSSSTASKCVPRDRTHRAGRQPGDHSTRISSSPSPAGAWIRGKRNACSYRRSRLDSHVTAI